MSIFRTFRSSPSTVSRTGMRFGSLTSSSWPPMVVLYLCRADANHPTSPSVEALLAHERRAGYENLDSYAAFAQKVHRAKRELLSFLIDCKQRGARICGYGAPGKGNTLLNYCGISPFTLQILTSMAR